MNHLESIKKHQQQIYSGFCTFIIYFALLFTFHGYLGIAEVSRLEVLLSLGILIYLFLFCICRVKGRLFLLALGVVPLVVEGLVLGIDRCRQILSGYVSWAVYGTVTEEYLGYYIVIQMLILAIVCSAVAYVVGKNRKLRIVSLGIAVVTVLCMLVLRMQVTNVATAFWLTYIFFHGIQVIEEQWEKKRLHKERNASMVWLWPVYVLFFVVMLLVPSSSEPYQWTFVKEAFTKVSDEFIRFSEGIRFGNGHDFEMKMSGFSEEGQIGGDMEKTKQDAFQITATKTLRTNLYLAGMTMDSFDGREWKGTKKEDPANARMDTLETYYGVLLTDEEKPGDYLALTQLQVTYGHFSSTRYFVPLKPTTLTSGEWDFMSGEKDAKKAFSKRKRYNDTYETGFFQLNLQQTVFEEMLRTCEIQRDEDLWEDVCRRFGATEFTYEDLLNYRKQIREDYSQNIVLSGRMQEWVAEVTADCENGYDCLKAMEQELQKLTYTTTPGKLPEEVDTPEKFLEYFILDHREGYCTYFATAMTLLARSRGYPARYVQGFCVPAKGQKEVQVKTWMSHAWCEVYFEGIGWIPFEATGGYEELRYTPWAVFVKQDTSYPDFSVRPEPVQEDTEVSEAQEIPQQGISAQRLRMLLVGMGMISLAGFLIFTGDLVIGRQNYKKKTNKEKYKQEAERTIRVLEKLGFKRKSYETLQELELKILEKCDREEQPPRFLKVYEEILYKELSVTEDMIPEVRRERKKMLTHLGRWTRIQEKYYLLKTGGEV